jgi:hypothetical protein
MQKARTFLTRFRIPDFVIGSPCKANARGVHVKTGPRENKTRIPRSTAEEDHIAAPGLIIQSGCNKLGSKHEPFTTFDYDPKLL